MGGASGHVKLEAPAKFIGKGFLAIYDWLEEIANWLELSPYAPNQWINIADTKLEKVDNSWFRAKKANIHTGDKTT